MASLHPSPATDWPTWIESDVIPHIVAQPLPYLATALAVVLVAYSTWRIRLQKLPPILNAPSRFDMSNSLAKLDFLNRAASLLKTATEEFGEKPVRIATDTGNLIVLPPNHLAQEIRNEPNLSFFASSQEDFHGKLPGFEPFNAEKAAGMLLKVTRNQLTKYLTKVTKPVSLEASFALHNLLGESTEWTEVKSLHISVRYVSSLSSRIFLGDELCRNKRWLETTSQYAVNSMHAVKTLRLFPKFTRPVVHWFLPECRLIRRLLGEAREIIQEVIDRRRAEKAAAAREGRPVPRPSDAIEWAEEESRDDPYDPAVYQIGLSMAAIHTTSDLLNQTLQNLVQRPALIDDLRREIVDVLRSDGMTKTALYNLKLMDSVLKETQRLKPIKMTTMHRLALADVKLSDGTVIPKGTKVAVRSTRRLDPATYADPEAFDGARFARMRDVPGPTANAAHLVTTGPDALGFGHGLHACPGRFFAANELKIALVHLLLKYDIAPTPEFRPRVIELGFDLRVDPSTAILVRRRQPEIDLDSLSF
ncbi:putative cytochrome p450 [Rosellinia necatrix]|uniref:Putative cytochrome p450 n=1 Tax=Rosellinia necatrix TaxID=77044 RepID=A0A1W2TS74_ROSNE|nr:putative cytochrome p450 [Rosellinia necatrix]